MPDKKKPTAPKKLTGPEYRPNAGCGVPGFGGGGQNMVPAREKLLNPATVDARRDAAELFEPYVTEALMVFVSCMNGAGTSADRVRMTAAKEVLDRVFGKPAVKHEIKSENLSVTADADILRMIPKDKVIELAGWMIRAQHAESKVTEIETSAPYAIQNGAKKKAANQKIVDSNKEAARKARATKMKGDTDDTDNPTE